jgi:WD40 repeat protein
VLRGHSASVYGLSFSPDGRTLASAGWDSRIILYDTTNWHEINRQDHGHTVGIVALAFSPDSHFIATEGGSGDDSVTVWNIPALTKYRSLKKVHQWPVQGLSFAAEGSEVVTAGEGNIITRWSLRTGQEQGSFAAVVGVEGDKILSFGVSADSKVIATGTSHGMLALWDLHTGACLSSFGPVDELPHITNGVQSLAISTDGQYVVAGLIAGRMSTGETVMWEVSTGKRWMLRSDGAVTRVAFAGGHRLLGIAGWEQPEERTKVKTWDVFTVVSQEPEEQ